jgi:DNA-binding protein H-NS
VREEEKAGVIARIREAIAVYELTPEELGLGHRPTQSAAPLKTSVSKPSKPTGARAAAPAPTSKYRDAAGNTWGGRGPKPNWLKAGLAAGRSLESFATEATPKRDELASSADAAAPKSKAAGGKLKKAVESVAKYRDGAGHTWSGRGPKPRWMVAAIASGKTLDQLAA